MIFLTDVFRAAPTLTNLDIGGGASAQPYGSSGLAGAPLANQSVTQTGGVGFSGLAAAAGAPQPSTRTVAAPTGPASDTNPGGLLPIGNQAQSTTGLLMPVQIAPQTQQTTQQTGSGTTGNTTGPVTTATDSSGSGGIDPAFQALLGLAGQQAAGGAGSGGIVALPTSVASGSSGGGGLSTAGIVLIVAVIAIGIYLYSRHKKKKNAEGGEKESKKND